MKRVPIFKPGRHTAANGTTLEFSEDQLARSIAAYDPAKHEAPLVIGHPKDNGPAWGWVKSMDFAEGEVGVTTDQVVAEFAEMVESGMFKKRSASWYMPGSANHPLAGTADHDTYYLRHVGFLGAMPPAVKGLSSIQFSEDEGVVEFTEDAYAWGSIASMLRGLRDYLLGKFGQEDADKALPGWRVEDLERQAARAMDEANKANSLPSFSDPTQDTTMTPEEIQKLRDAAAAATARADKLEADNTALAANAANFAEREKAVAASEHAAKVAGIKADLEQHVTAGRLLPREVAPLAEFMAGLDDKAETIEFGEGTDAKKLSPRAFLAQFLAARPKSVEFGELAGGTVDGKAGALTADQLADKATAYRKTQLEAGKEISFAEAVNAVIATENGA